ncbi:glycoside hydrolase family 13 protein [Mycena crocata]|nr:glycoside hydrolase family 13 protein [Mycena crocata]
MYSTMLLLSLTLFSAVQATIAASAEDWRGRSIYQVMVDRFARTDGSLTYPCHTNERVYCGGTWRGLINRLSYISDMGFTAIWLSPIMEQIPGNTGEGEAYHGYWPMNMYQINSRFGTEQDLKDLIDAIHARKMYIMVDIVINHFANQGETVDYSKFVPFNEARFFHPRCEVDWGNQSSIENCWMGNGYVLLPDIDTENPFVVRTLQTYVSSLVTKFNLDGIRLDACRNIRKPFWDSLCAAAGVYCQGEVWDRNPEIICPYQDHMNGLHNYPIKETATEVFTSSAGNISNLVTVGHKMQTQCKDVTLFGTFMENHDNPRLGSFTTDMARLKNLACVNILTDGIPIVYYGQEQALTGGNDPANREALWLTGYPHSNLVPTFTALNSFRNYIVPTSTFVKTLATYTQLSSDVVSVRKGNLVLVLKNSGSNVMRDMSIEGFGSGIEQMEVLSCTALRPDAGGKLPVILRGEPLVLYPRSLLSGSGICGL